MQLLYRSLPSIAHDMRYGANCVEVVVDAFGALRAGYAALYLRPLCRICRSLICLGCINPQHLGRMDMAYGYGRLVMGVVDVYTEGCAVLPLVRSTYCLSGGLEVDLMAGNAIHARESQAVPRQYPHVFVVRLVSIQRVWRQRLSRGMRDRHLAAR